MAQAADTLSYTARLPGYDIHAHLAQEEALLNALPPGGAALLLWRSEPCVVIGRNQNAYTQCDIDRINALGVRLARRRTGGGAVYHDMGNLCFSFITHGAGRAEFIDCVADALRALGVSAARSGNDIEVAGSKVSGSAFLAEGDRRLHHGTLLIDSDLDALAAMLKPGDIKLRAKGVESVRARVENLRAFAPGVTVETVCGALAASFAALYPGCAERGPDAAALEAAAPLEARYRSHAWIYGQALPFGARMACRRPSGTFIIDADVERGVVVRCAVDTDARDAVRAAALAAALNGVLFERGALESAIDAAMGGGG